jgi:cytochrome c biogenesis protein CcdA/thiol-disulfide isomerase/thioredoxin
VGSVLVLIGIGLVAGVITSVSPCILPVLPIVLTAGAGEGGWRRPLLIIGGLVASFTVFTLAAASILSALGLPPDFLRNLAIVLLFVLAGSLLSKRFAFLLERPLAFMTRRQGGHPTGGFVLGLSLGLVFVPCAGPVLATVTVLAAKNQVGFETVVLTVAYGVGFGIPMLLIALGGQRVAKRLRASGPGFRRASGIVLALSALGILFNLPQTLQTRLGGYSSVLQAHVENTKLARDHLAKLRGGSNAFAATQTRLSGSSLPVLGKAPEFTGIDSWLNTDGDRPLTLKQLRGKVVLVDFWTYSCINCIRTLPHLRAWYAAYHRSGFEIVGVHTPEFAFEHVRSNVRQATRDLHVSWPVALDNRYKTWDAYSNEYWPAEYLVDRAGRVRRTHFGEGEYGDTEKAIRSLLAASGKPVQGSAQHVADATPTAVVTPETYLGYVRIDPTRYRGSALHARRAADYRSTAALRRDQLSYSGSWTIGDQRALADANARLRLRFHAHDVYLVLGGRGRVQVLIDGKPTRTVAVNGDRLYTLVSSPALHDGLLELRFDRGVNAYAFTFG